MSSTSPEPGTPEKVHAEPEARLAASRSKLRAALEGLDAAISLRTERALDQADQAAEFAAMQEDRSRLAQELEAATARLRMLEAANGEATLRVERASAAVRAVLAADRSADPSADPSADTPADASADTSADTSADSWREN